MGVPWVPRLLSALAHGKQFAMAAGVSNFTYLKLRIMTTLKQTQGSKLYSNEKMSRLFVADETRKTKGKRKLRLN